MNRKMNSEQSISNVKPTTWTCIDGLGRVMSTCEQVGEKRKDRTVAIFYFPCHGFWPEIRYARNVMERLSKTDEKTIAEAKNDYNHPLWATPNPEEDSWYWDEPIFGYYDTHDEYVLRKHAEMLADAGVDLIAFDCCVGLQTTSSYHTVFKVFEEALQDGVNSPKVTFVLPMGNPERCRSYMLKLYDEIYSKGKYKDCWFYYEDENGVSKPLIFAWNDHLKREDPLESEILNFFSYRRPDPYSWRFGDEWDRIIADDVDESIRHNGTPDYVGPKDKIEMGWLNTFPQTKYYGKDNNKLILDNMPVSVAQNVDVVKHTATAMNGINPAGRSYIYGYYKIKCNIKGREVTITPDSENAMFYGLNFQQQWDYAISSDPRLIFVTGWNEWTMGRYPTFSFVYEGGEIVSNAFVDQYNAEYSRDTEPSAGIMKDYYYYQLTENIRRYKGADRLELENVNRSIDIHGDTDQWKDVSSYEHYLRSTRKRNHNGCIGYIYKNETMRNDIVRAKAAYDNQYIYFYVETLEPITPSTDSAWMRLFICTDLTENLPNWEGFNYVINRVNPENGLCTVEKSLGGWMWEKAGDAEYSVKNNILQIKVCRKLLSMESGIPEFHFKWSDNMQKDGDIMDFYINGDVAPGGRFMFHFKG